MNKSYLLKCGDVSIRCNKYEIFISKGPAPDPSYKKCDISVLNDIVSNIKHLVINSREKVILYFDDENKHIYRDDRFDLRIRSNSIYISHSYKNSKLDSSSKYVSEVDSLLNQLNDFLSVK